MKMAMVMALPDDGDTINVKSGDCVSRRQHIAFFEGDSCGTIFGWNIDVEQMNFAMFGNNISRRVEDQTRVVNIAAALTALRNGS